MPKLHASLEVFLRQPAPKSARRADVEKALELLSFYPKGAKGSHHHWEHPDGRRIGYSLVHGRTVKRWVVEALAAEIRKTGIGE